MRDATAFSIELQPSAVQETPGEGERRRKKSPMEGVVFGRAQRGITSRGEGSEPTEQEREREKERWRARARCPNK